MRQFLLRRIRRRVRFLAASFSAAVLIMVDGGRAQQPAAPDAVLPDRPDVIAVPKKRGFQWLPNAKEVVPQSGKRNHLFYVGEAVTFELGPTADRFEVRDYYGEMVDHGPVPRGSADALPRITSKVTQPGWYKLYLYGKPAAVKKPLDPLDNLLGDVKTPTKEDEKAKQVRAVWGDVVGGTTFVIFRNDKNFPARDDVKSYEKSGAPNDQVFRALSAMGPQRHQADANDPAKSIELLEKEIRIDRELYVGRDPARPRPLLIAFGGGTKNLDGVRQIVEHFQNDVEYWEPRNEPNFGASPADFVEKEMKPFYETVKGVSPKLKVIGPGTVSYNQGMLGWMEGFFKAGGAKYLDGLSFHAYNCINGDLFLGRRALEELNSMLAKYDGAEKLEKWQTEQGYFACVYGSYQPRLQGRWTMLEMMIYEQYGIPKEHNHLWYDRSHGFWDFPTWWENDHGSLNPAAPLMRVWSEELFATRFEQDFDFGVNGNRMYLGSLFGGGDKRVAVFQSAGMPDGRVTLRVSGAATEPGSSLRVVSPFGVESEVKIESGRAVVPVSELPTYVRLAPGQTVAVEPVDWGDNLARAGGVQVTASGKAEHPTTKPDTPPEKLIRNDPAKIVNGEYENWYRTLKREYQPWMSNVEAWPATVEIKLPQQQRLARVVVFAAPPWQNQGTLLDYELQVEQAGKWITIDRIQEPTRTIKVFTPPTRTAVDSFFSDRWIFEHEFEPVTTTKVRLLVHDVTHGGGATAAVGEIGGQAGLKQLTLREVELYGR